MVLNQFEFPFWGKTDKIRGGQHSHLLAHMLPVGSVMDVLLLQPAIQRVIVESSKVPIQQIRPLLIWIGILHDIGKLLPEFQWKCDWVLHEIGVACGKNVREKFSHGDEGYHQLALRDGEGVMADLALAGKWTNRQHDLVGDLWAGACAHHGHHVGPSELEIPEGKAAEKVVMIAKKLATYTRSLVERVVGPVIVPDLSFDKPLIQVFSGLVALADWLGSDENTFSFISIPTFETVQMRDATSIDQFYGTCCDKAARRIADVGFGVEATVDFDTIEAAFGKALGLDYLRPMQKAVYHTVRDTDCAGLLIIEDTMGAGKTEAALIAAGELIKKGCGQGVVFALPSRASADQTFSRLNNFSARLFGTEPNLSHGSAGFSRPRLLQKLALSDEKMTGNESAEHLSDWITTSSKRAFLAPVCAATVDQVMLAAMDCRHGFVRAACITRHVVIIDEVHAYDEYMGSILDNLIEFLGACATPIILLSATLPKASRLKYINAYRRGRRLHELDLATLNAPDTYPLLTSVVQCGKASFPSLPADDPSQVKGDTFDMKAQRYARSRRAVDINLRQESDIYAKLIMAAQGGCSAIVCNTVASAFRRYEELKQRTSGMGIKVLLLHSKYRLCDRQHIADNMLLVCGKASGNTSRRGHIVVATQVIEQSLDLDFDYMGSEIAPIDLLLQRLGRLFRHYREYRPEGFENPMFDVMDVDGAEDNSAWLRGTRRVYDNESVLSGTLAWLRANRSVVLPEGISKAVSAVYDNFVQNKSGNIGKIRGKTHAINFALEVGENIVRDTEQSSDTRGSEGGQAFLFVRTNAEGEPLDLLTGMPVPWLDFSQGNGISVEFLAYANACLINLRTTQEKGATRFKMPGDDMVELAGKSTLNAILSQQMKYPPFLIVECYPRKAGQADVVRIGNNYVYSKDFGFNQIN